MRPILIALMLLVTASVAHAQSNPCSDSSPSGIVPLPDTLYARLPDHTAVFGANLPLVELYEAAYFANGTVDPNTSPIVQGPSSIPKVSFTLVAGTPDCYMVRPFPMSIPTTGPPLVAAVRGRRTSNTPVVGAWSGASNPFGPPEAAARAPVVGRVLVIRSLP